MNFKEYQELAQRTANPDLNKKEKLINAALGLSGEVGEVNDVIKKHLAQGHPLNVEKIIDEAGDVLWYLSELAEVMGTTLSDIAEGNIRKLSARYPEGFSSNRSMNRE